MTECVSSQPEKHRITFEHFKLHIGACSERKHHINFAEPQWQPRNLQHLELPFSEQEVETTIKSMPKEKASGPDGLIRLFFKKCWSIIKEDIIGAVNQLYNINQQGLNFLNQALVVLIPKNPMQKKSLTSDRSA
jgi:hypothetical protein